MLAQCRGFLPEVLSKIPRSEIDSIKIKIKRLISIESKIHDDKESGTTYYDRLLKLNQEIDKDDKKKLYRM